MWAIPSIVYAKLKLAQVKLQLYMQAPQKDEYVFRLWANLSKSILCDFSLSRHFLSPFLQLAHQTMQLSKYL